MSFRTFLENLFRTRTYTGNVIGVILTLTICMAFLLTFFYAFQKGFSTPMIPYLEKLTDIIKDILLLVLGGIIKSAIVKNGDTES